MELVHARGGLGYFRIVLFFFGEERCETEHVSVKFVGRPPVLTKWRLVVVSEFDSETFINDCKYYGR